MQTTTPVQVGKQVHRFLSDEVHLIGKLIGNPAAVLTFRAVTDDGAVIADINAITLRLEGTAFRQFYDDWNSEKSLYEAALLALDLDGSVIVSGGDVLDAIGGHAQLEVPDEVAEVLPVEE